MTRIQAFPIPQRVATRQAYELTGDVAWLQTLMVNVYFVGEAGSSDWVLIDTGLWGFSGHIMRSAEERFGSFAPKAIILTHGHFDHVGNLRELLDHWVCPVYAHPWELPYIAGRADYPPPDPTVGGGLVARLSSWYPNKGEDLGCSYVDPLPADGSVPHLPGWRWIHTPGHTPGHISLFRDSDRMLIAGDAFTTQKQESLYAVLSNAQEVHGPPAYFTIDWRAAHESVRRLADLEPEFGATGHGIPMRGEPLRSQLRRVAEQFERIVVPRRGRYVQQPVIADACGIVWMPPSLPKRIPLLLAAGGIGLLVAGWIARGRRSRQRY